MPERDRWGKTSVEQLQGHPWTPRRVNQEITPHAPAGARNFNCGLFLDAGGGVLGCYEKMFPVMFGEYVPLADQFPWLYSLTPLPAGLTAGTSTWISIRSNSGPEIFAW